MTTVLGPLKLQEVASFVTNRSTWKLVLSRADKEEPPLVVDLDTADFGYAVGEIEALVHEKAEVPAAIEKIDKLSSMLGEGDRPLCASPVPPLAVPTGPVSGEGLGVISLMGIVLAIFSKTQFA